MPFEDLAPTSPLQWDPDRGVLLLAGCPALAVDALATAILRRDLVDQMGLAAARALLTQFGFNQGRHLAEASAAHPPDDPRRTGMTLAMGHGACRLGPELFSDQGASLADSFEAGQHVAHLGRGDSAVCWATCGLASGYLSRILGLDLVVLEDRCRGKGDPECRFRCRPRNAWGDARAGELRFMPGQRPAAQVRQEDLEPMGLVARSQAMRQLIDLAQRVARVDSTLLISGESGTGKERVARLVHRTSARAPGPFIAVNCGAITETLLESELFGHARGAFTGATQEHPGLFEAANGGTLLLDEVGEVSPAMQVKLLRVLQEHEVRRVGESASRPIDVRVIAATNRELAQETAAGRFRQDLYYRLHVIELPVPPLRQRREDILPLARLLLADAAARLNRPLSALSPRAAEQLLRYPWPGNVRELENAMERAVALARGGSANLEDLPEEVRRGGPVPLLAQAVQPLAAVEKDYILAVLASNAGNQSRTAEQLGIGSATLYRKLKTYGLTRPRDGRPYRHRA